MKFPKFNYYNCTTCPRDCKSNRYQKPGAYCKLDSKVYIASIFNHLGEEPPIMGRFVSAMYFLSIAISNVSIVKTGILVEIQSLQLLMK